LPDHFDFIVVGTGFQESVLSGAFSRVGKTVLHIDPNNYYGDDWSSFNINSFQNHIEKSQEAPQSCFDSVEYNCEENEEIFMLKPPIKTLKNGRIKSNEAPKVDNARSDESVEEEDQQDTSVEDQQGDTSVEDQQGAEEETTSSSNIDADWIKAQWRRTNIDLAPKMLLSRGELVKLLIKSNVSRYLTFKEVNRILTTLNEDAKCLEKVPCSRSDVFNTKLIKMIEKNKLMKVLTIALDYENQEQKYEAYKEKPFREYLRDGARLNKNLQDFIIYCISMVGEDASTVEGLHAAQSLVKSVGQYGNGAFLWSMYGVGELPQAFSRLSAVFGGVFCLQRGVRALVLEKNSKKCKAIIDSTGQKISCDHLIMNEKFLINDDDDVYPRQKFHRAVYINDNSICKMDSDKTDPISMAILKPTGEEPLVKLLEISSSGEVCPRDCYMVHAYIDASQTRDHDGDLPQVFERTEKLLFKNRADSSEGACCTNHWAAYFTMTSHYDVTNKLSDIENVWATPGPDMSVTFQQSINEAKEIFEKILPTEDFLPRAPDCDEIIMETDEDNNNEEQQQHEQQRQEETTERPNEDNVPSNGDE